MTEKFTSLNRNEEIIEFQYFTEEDFNKLEEQLYSEWDKKFPPSLIKKIGYYVAMFFEGVNLAIASAFLVGGIVALVIFSPINEIEPNFLNALVAACLIWVSFWSLWKNALLRELIDYLYPKVYAWVGKELFKWENKGRGKNE